MTPNRILRLSAAAVLCATVIWAMLPHAISYVSTSAVVNAPLITIRSPIDGQIAVASPGLAEAVPIGARMAEVTTHLPDRRLLAELTARAREIDALLTAVDAKVARLTAVRSDLQARDGQLRAQMSAWLAARRQEIGATLAGARAARDETAARVDRSQMLARTGTVTAAALRHDEAELESARALVAMLEAQLQTAALEAEALDEGVLVQSGAQGAGYPRQRLDDVALRLADVEGERAQLEAEQVGIAARIRAARQELHMREVFAPVAAANGVVWRASGAPGAGVLAGDEILQVLDCEHRFVEVSVPERHFDAIRLGARAYVELRGSAGRLEGTVSAVRGAGSKFEHPLLAAETPHVGEGQLRVLVVLDGGVPEGDADRHFCDVGRTAEVSFDRPGTAGLAGVVRMIGAWLGATAPAVFAAVWTDGAAAAP